MFNQIHRLFFIFFLIVTVDYSGEVRKNTEKAVVRTDVIIPTETIELFNKKDLSGFYTWLEDYKYDDPYNVFSVVDQIDGAPAIRISGEHWGGLITENSFTDYHLIAEFRWGAFTSGSRKDRARNSGIFLHSQNPDGSGQDDFNSPWMRSIEYNMLEGGTGDIVLVGGYNKSEQYIPTQMKAMVSLDYNEQYVWDANGQERTFERGRINWYGRDPDWQDVLGFRGVQDIENPVGKWNRIEVICNGNSFVFLLNGVIMSKGFGSNLTKGKLYLQSQGAEVFFRRIELRPLP